MVISILQLDYKLVLQVSIKFSIIM